MTLGWLIGTIIGSVIGGVIWGCATDAVIKNKGYDENWFWWGFFFGVIALIVAATKPEKRQDIYNIQREKRIIEEYHEKRLLQNGGWSCICGRTNPNYTGTCACGRTKNDSQTEKTKIEEAEKQIQSQKTEHSDLDELKKFKELLDMGVITQEEFDAKKKQYLGL